MKNEKFPFFENVFLDTSVFEEQNFFHGSKIRSLFHYSNLRFINLFMTTISKMELVDRMRTRLIDCKSDYNKLAKTFNNQEQRILKNIDLFDYLKLPTITVENSLQQLIQKLDINIKANNIQIINSESVIAEDVFERYYKNLPPFGLGKKKHEFPDAFIILNLEAWCKVNKKKMIVLSKDMDFLKFKSRHLIFIDNIADLLQEITKQYDTFRETNVIPTVNQLLVTLRPELIEEIKEKIGDKIFLSTDYEKTSDFKMEKIDYYSHKITSIRNNYAEVELMIELKFSINVFPDPLDIERAVFEDKVSRHKLIKKILVPVDIEVYFRGLQTAKIKWINSNDPVMVDFY
jgi:hypothetical protein